VKSKIYAYFHHISMAPASPESNVRDARAKKITPRPTSRLVHTGGGAGGHRCGHCDAALGDKVHLRGLTALLTAGKYILNIIWYI